MRIATGSAVTAVTCVTLLACSGTSAPPQEQELTGTIVSTNDGDPSSAAGAEAPSQRPSPTASGTTSSTGGSGGAAAPAAGASGDMTGAAGDMTGAGGRADLRPDSGADEPSRERNDGGAPDAGPDDAIDAGPDAGIVEPPDDDEEEDDD